MTLALPRFTASLIPAALPVGEVEGLYVHVPFCFHKCHYCDFYSITRQTPERMEQFVDRILSEAKQWVGPGGPTVRPRTVFFGGGTPSLLPIEAMGRLIRGLRELFDFSELAEWTIECNPATVDLAYCSALREAGVDRLSFGAQSFDRPDLVALERHHDPEDVPRSIDLARQAGFKRLNLDLIFAIPGQTLQSWARTLETGIALNTSHISCYGLTYEPNTALAVRKRLGQFIPAAETLELEMLFHARSRLTQAGIAPYEISNFAAPGQECQHNVMYWLGGNYIGLGPSAASHVRGTRWKNRPHLGEWESAIDSAELPAVDLEILTPHQRAGELAMLMLRLARGLNYSDFSARTGSDPRQLWPDVLDRLSKPALIEITSDCIRLTDKGLPLADAIAAEFLLTAPPA